MPSGNWAYSPALHWREAARWAGVLWCWERMERDEQARVVAQYETITRLEALDAKEHDDRMKA